MYSGNARSDTIIVRRTVKLDVEGGPSYSTTRADKAEQVADTAERPRYVAVYRKLSDSIIHDPV